MVWTKYLYYQMKSLISLIGGIYMVPSTEY